MFDEDILEEPNTGDDLQIVNVFLQNSVVLTGILGDNDDEKLITLINPVSNINGVLENFETYSDQNYLVLNPTAIISITVAKKELAKTYLENIEKVNIRNNE